MQLEFEYTSSEYRHNKLSYANIEWKYQQTHTNWTQNWDLLNTLYFDEWKECVKYFAIATVIVVAEAAAVP